MILFSEKNIAIDAGGSNLRVYKKRKGEVFFEPNIVVYTKKKKVVATGKKARDMIGRTPQGLEAVTAIQDGKVRNSNAFEDLFEGALRDGKIKSAGITRLNVYVCTRYGLDDIDKTSFMRGINAAGNIRTRLVDKTLATAFGEGFTGKTWDSMMIVNVGKETSEAATLTYGGIVSCKTENIGGGNIDDAIALYIRHQYGVMVPKKMAEVLKIRLGNVMRPENAEVNVTGVYLLTGLPKVITITGEEIFDCIREIADKIVMMIDTVAQKTPVEVLHDIQKKHIIFTGGGSQLRGLDKLTTETLGIKVVMSKDPINSTVKGAIKAFKFAEMRHRKYKIIRDIR